MKKLLSAALFSAGLLCLSAPANAQSLLLGIKAGANFDRTQGTHLDDDFTGSFVIGAYGGVKMANIKVQADLLFSQNRVYTGESFKAAYGQYLSQNATNIKDGTFKMNELSVPIVVGYNVLPGFLWVLAGPQYTGVVSIKDVNGLVRETKDVFKSGYLSGVVGAEVSLPFSLNAGLRYIFGLSDRNNTDVPDSWRSSHFQLHVGYSFMK